MTERPPGKPIVHMEWANLAFLHWPVPADVLRVPDGLEVETFDGTAWIGLVPFTMPVVRRIGWPKVPTTHCFHECNVRTYVRDRNGDSGVWFFSLDAASRLVVWFTRWWWNLNYVHAAITLDRDGDRTDYRLTRSGEPDVSLRAEWSAGDALPESQPGEFAYFLTERYAMYAADRRGRLWRGRIWHPPWPLREAELHGLDGNLCAHAAGLDPALVDGAPFVLHVDHIAVDAWPLAPIT